MTDGLFSLAILPPGQRPTRNYSGRDTSLRVRAGDPLQLLLISSLPRSALLDVLKGHPCGALCAAIE